jgi:CDP-glucose 4,6-dehydratase
MAIQKFYQGKKVFITGHTGFKGAWLAYWLTQLGAEVTGYALAPAYADSLFELLGLSDKITHNIGDIRNQEQLFSAMQSSQPDLVFHLAAQALVHCAYDEPLLTLETNVIGSANLLENIRHIKSIKSLIYITSDKCYWNNEWAWGYRETDMLGGADPYSASKACAEHVFKTYYLSYFKDRLSFGCASTRAGNVIGGGDRAENRIVPDIIRSIEKKQPVFLRNPHATRPWQHVLDPLYGYLCLGMNLYENPTEYNGQAWNFGPSNQSIKTVLELTTLMNSVWPSMEIQIESHHKKHHESTLLHLSIDKANTLLKWTPKIAFTEAVLKTAQWYKRVQEGVDPVLVTQEQMQAFMHV